VTSAHDRDEFDAVVIGSGFGGAVAAARLAERGVPDVLVLERGMPYPPGSFARTPREMRDGVWDPATDRYGPLELLKFSHVTAVISSGLGGGSLVYANVMLRKPPETFGADQANGWREWPISYAQLEEGYAAVEARMGPTEMPYDSYAVPKTEAFKTALDGLGLKPTKAPIAVTFAARDGEPPQPGMPLLDGAGKVETDNLHHRPRRSCTLCGDCDFGCNEGAKNTLDYNFLTAFVTHPSGRKEIRTCCEALDIAGPLPGGGYEIRYRQHQAARDKVKLRAAAEQQPGDLDLIDSCDEELRTVRAKVVILGAGTFGSTRLLLASRCRLPRLSAQLGRGFSSNGDLLKFAFNCRRDGEWRDIAPSRGPVITAYAEAAADGHQTWLEDGGFPRGMEMMWQVTEAPQDLWKMRSVLWRMLRRRLFGNVGGQYMEAIGTAHASGSMLPLLAMGRDVPGGVIELDGDSLTLDWDPDAASNGYFSFVERCTRALADRLGGHAGDRGLRGRILPGRGTCAHPLGGCRMGRTEHEGVIGTDGQVFGCEGLYVADGAVMPGPVGPNPSLTIGAISHLIAGHAAERASS
jgi:cholesterol oxidase